MNTQDQYRITPDLLTACHTVTKLRTPADQEREINKACAHLTAALSGMQSTICTLLFDGSVDYNEMERDIEKVAYQLGTMEALLQKAAYLYCFPQQRDDVLRRVDIARYQTFQTFAEEARHHGLI